ncbi:helix-turn-helix transcriptional regulator [Nocardioides stalactiti]|uniref:helix-turn-helix transcriptional regulator n=1 Tax=Nocardioides stalactiti TaxID=2755356 RepID=UPI0016016A1A|nr:LuxR C-terminal-related transcriptional regulator [Nocardioides stalactiti]
MEPDARVADTQSVVADLLAGGAVVVVGDPGSGRTSLATRVVEGIGGAIHVRGAEAVAEVPLLPFAGLVGAADAGRPTVALYEEVPRNLRAGGSVLVVDDADRLDQGSAVLLAQAVRAGVPTLVTAGSSRGLSQAVRGALELRGARVVALGPLAPAALLAWAEALLGGELEVPSGAALVDRCAGLPAIAVRLLTEATSSGAVRPGDGGIRITGFAPDRDVLALAGHDTTDLTVEVSDLVAVIGLVGAVPVELFDTAAVQEAVRRRLVTLVDGVLVVGGPLVEDAWRRRTAPRAAASLAARALAHADVGVPETTRAALHVLSGAERDPEKVVTTVDWLLGRGWTGDAAMLLDQLAETTKVLIKRAEIAAAEGDRTGAVTLLDRAVHGATDDHELLLIVRGWIRNLRGRVDDHAELEDRVRSILSTLGDPVVRAQVRSLLVERRVILGDVAPDGAARDAGEVPFDGSAAAALRAVMDGRLDDARDRLLPAEPAAAEGEHDEQMKVLAHFLSLVYDDRLVEARQVAERQQQRALAERRPILGLWSYNRTKIAFHAGQYDEAALLGADARRHLAWHDVTGLALPADALVAAALARLGRGGEAHRLVTGVAADELLLPRVRIGVARVRAEEIRASRPTAAAELLWEAGIYALENNELFSGVLTVDESFMVRPGAEAADLLASVRDRSALVAAFADRAEAVLAGDPAALEAAAQRFEALVLPGRAAHAWRLAADLRSRRGEELSARAALRAAGRITAAWDLNGWPDAVSFAGLSPREREVAAMAADRLRTKEIADRLGLSPRTVDNHLHSVYTKLGVSRRDDLAAALGSDPSSYGRR